MAIKNKFKQAIDKYKQLGIRHNGYRVFGIHISKQLHNSTNDLMLTFDFWVWGITFRIWKSKV